jgi:hypothetical protein
MLLQTGTTIVAQVTTINHYSVHNQNHFGWAITGNNSYCFISDPRDSSTSYANGCVNMYKHFDQSWIYVNTLKYSGSNPYSYFGYALAFDNDILAISAIGNDKMGFMAGAVYIYLREGDSLRKIQEIYPNSHKKNIFFGKALKICDNYLLVGAPGINNRGGVYIYKWNGTLFEFQTQLEPDDLIKNSDFGSSFACSGDTIYIGAPGGGTENERQGAVYIYIRHNNYIVLNEKIMPGHEFSGSLFGYSLSANNNKLLIGAPHAYLNRHERIYFAGKVCLYENNGAIWEITDTLMNPNPVSHDLFGTSVWFVDSMVVVSIPRSDDYSNDAGEVCVYKKNENIWVENSIVVTPPNNTSYFGSSIYLHNKSLWIGLSGNKDNMSIGTVYYYNLDNILETKISSFQQFKVYPNPVKEILTVEFSEPGKNRYSLYSNDGKRAKSGITYNQKFDLNLSDLFPGVYILSIWNEKNCNTIKIMKK